MNSVSSKLGGTNTLIGSKSRKAISLQFIACNCDVDPFAVRFTGSQKYPELTHTWIDGETIESLNIQYIPNRIIINTTTPVCKGGKEWKIVNWWDGSFGNVLKGPWASSKSNPCKGLLSELQGTAKNL